MLSTNTLLFVFVSSIPFCLGAAVPPRRRDAPFLSSLESEIIPYLTNANAVTISLPGSETASSVSGSGWFVGDIPCSVVNSIIGECVVGGTTEIFDLPAPTTPTTPIVNGGLAAGSSGTPALTPEPSELIITASTTALPADAESDSTDRKRLPPKMVGAIVASVIAGTLILVVTMVKIILWWRQRRRRVQNYPPLEIQENPGHGGFWSMFRTSRDVSGHGWESENQSQFYGRGEGRNSLWDVFRTPRSVSSQSTENLGVGATEKNSRAKAPRPKSSRWYGDV